MRGCSTSPPRPSSCSASTSTPSSSCTSSRDARRAPGRRLVHPGASSPCSTTSSSTPRHLPHRLAAEPSPRAEILGPAAAHRPARGSRRSASSSTSATPRSRSVACAAGLRAGRSPCRPASRPALLGETLRIRHGETELRVPGGCDLAPAGTPSDPAGAWAESAREKPAGPPAGPAQGRAHAGIARPARRCGKRTEDAAKALAERRRWPDLLALTDVPLRRAREPAAQPRPPARRGSAPLRPRRRGARPADPARQGEHRRPAHRSADPLRPRRPLRPARGTSTPP